MVQMNLLSPSSHGSWSTLVPISSLQCWRLPQACSEWGTKHRSSEGGSSRVGCCPNRRCCCLVAGFSVRWALALDKPLCSSSLLPLKSCWTDSSRAVGKEAGLQAELFLLGQVIMEEAYRRWRAFRKAEADSEFKAHMQVGQRRKKCRTVLQEMKSYLPTMFFPKPVMNTT